MIILIAMNLFIGVPLVGGMMYIAYLHAKEGYGRVIPITPLKRRIKMNVASQVAVTSCKAGLNWPGAFAIVGCVFAFVAIIYIIVKYNP